MKKQKYKLNRNDLIELKDMGYEIHEFTPYHFRVWKFKKEKYLDIFPTTHVYCFYLEGELKGKGKYQELIELVETKLDDFVK